MFLSRLVLFVSYFEGYHKLTDEITFVKKVSAVTFLNENEERYLTKKTFFCYYKKKTDLC